MTRYFRSLTLVLCGVLLAPLAFGGFEKTVNFGARAAGMGGIAIAQNNTISAAFYNPAHFKYVDSWTFGVDTSPTIVGASIGLPAGVGGTQNADFFFLPIFNAAGAFRINDSVLVGIGVYSPAGLATEYSSYGLAAFGLTKVKVDFKVIEAAPFVVFELSEGFAVAIQWRPTYAIFNQTVTGAIVHKNLDRFEFLSGRIGISHEINENWHWGFAVRSVTKATLTGTTTVPGLGAAGAAGTPISIVDIVLPWELMGGLAYIADDQAWTLAFEVGYRTYSQIPKIDFDISSIPGNEAILDIITMFNDSLVVRLGGEIKVAKRWFVRLGGTIATPATSKLFDSPVLSTPGLGLVGAAGFGYQADGWSVDVSYDLTLANSTGSTVTAPIPAVGVKRSNTVHALGLSINLLGKKKQVGEG